jgi:hypothetical protein
MNTEIGHALTAGDVLLPATRVVAITSLCVCRSLAFTQSTTGLNGW